MTKGTWALFFVLCAALLASLGHAPLFDLDETIYAQAAHEMRTFGRLFSPTVNGEAFFEKPPAFYWLLMLSFSIFGEHEWSARLVSAIASVACAAILMRVAGSVIGSHRAMMAALVFLSTLQVQMLARAAILDALLNTFIAASLLFYLRWHALGKTRDAVWAAVASGIAVAIKGPVGVVVPVLVVFAERALAGGGRAMLNLMRTFPWRLATFAFLLAALPEYLLTAWHEGAGFFFHFFIRHNLMRAAAPMQGHAGGWLYYLWVFFVGGLPWSAAAMLALGQAWRRRKGTSPEDGALRLALAWVVVVLVLFSLVRTKLPHYISSIWPAVAIAVACVPSPQGLRFGAAIVGGLALVLTALPWLWPEIVAAVHHPRAVAALADAAPPAPSFALWGVMLLGAVIATIRGARLWSGALLGGVLGIVLALGIVPLAGRIQQGPLLAAAAYLRTLPEDVPVYSFALQAPSVSFYAKRNYQIVHTPEELARLSPPFVLLLREEARDRLPSALKQAKPVMKKGGYLLYRVLDDGH